MTIRHVLAFATVVAMAAPAFGADNRSHHDDSYTSTTSDPRRDTPASSRGDGCSKCFSIVPGSMKPFNSRDGRFVNGKDTSSGTSQKGFGASQNTTDN